MVPPMRVRAEGSSSGTGPALAPKATMHQHLAEVGSAGELDRSFVENVNRVWTVSYHTVLPHVSFDVGACQDYILFHMQPGPRGCLGFLDKTFCMCGVGGFVGGPNAGGGSGEYCQGKY